MFSFVGTVHVELLLVRFRFWDVRAAACNRNAFTLIEYKLKWTSPVIDMADREKVFMPRKEISGVFIFR